MNIFEKIFFTSSESYTPQSQCSECTHNICCVVFDILSEYNQWRDYEIVKKGGIPCVHLGENGCKIYNNRGNGAWRSCITYECQNVWPLLSHWLTKNNINIMTHSAKIGQILDYCQNFLKSSNKDIYEKKIIFLKNFLQTVENPENFLQKIKNPENLEWEFQEFFNS